MAVPSTALTQATAAAASIDTPGTELQRLLLAVNDEIEDHPTPAERAAIAAIARHPNLPLAAWKICLYFAREALADNPIVPLTLLETGGFMDIDYKGNRVAVRDMVGASIREEIENALVAEVVHGRRRYLRALYAWAKTRLRDVSTDNAFSRSWARLTAVVKARPSTASSSWQVITAEDVENIVATVVADTWDDAVALSRALAPAGWPQSKWVEILR